MRIGPTRTTLRFETKEVIKNKTLNVEFITDDPTFVTQIKLTTCTVTP